ncbi:MaoC family dehydratase [Sporolactobacillus sp. CQH2019]|uniref:MaoC family dehydratase n=1 Tax=Sporolactobacillus sp. CQH2019 TaxID=3023512 RepID=UPI0023678BC8|nr:MaoC family dehydratase [Sporolactobacillus sp. CQH2019]MDD9148183.1 MaoC family dehydratase [Sporolactobacillus sp. CQH2019]
MNYEEIKIGDSATISKTVTVHDVETFAGVTGDFNPLHINAEYAKNSRFKERIAHGILTAGFISTVLGTKLPGEGGLYLGQNLKFTAPVKFGDTVTAKATVTEKRDDKRIVKLHTVVTNQNGKTVIDGEAVMMIMEKK